MSRLRLNSLIFAAYSSRGFKTLTGLYVVAQARPHAVRKLIYLNAPVPRQGKSYLDFAGEGFGYALDSLLHDDWLMRPLPSLTAGDSPLHR